MARIRVITDSASDLPEIFAQQLNIDVVSLTIRFGDEEFVDRVDLTPEVFWAKCKASKTLPETAAPSPGAFQAAFERAQHEGYDGVVVLTLSSLLSATHQSATLAAETVEGLINVKVIDTLSVSMGQGLLVIEAAELAAQGATLDEVVTRTEQLMKRSGVVATLDTLDHLIKGGRIGGESTPRTSAFHQAIDRRERGSCRRSGSPTHSSKGSRIGCQRRGGPRSASTLGADPRRGQ